MNQPSPEIRGSANRVYVVTLRVGALSAVTYLSELVPAYSAKGAASEYLRLLDADHLFELRTVAFSDSVEDDLTEMWAADLIVICGQESDAVIGYDLVPSDFPNPFAALLQNG